ncbi:hypothetical protein GBP42_04910 [Pediococcus acidilactici]|nr:hypothetical protein GBP21_04910 [Pediococcus acidilactici]KAF0539601.1 hypothetical protein GBP39_04005 [Pediococcus acidilactici]KAF0546264.1 hypothetical protein GBP42_04910 [Pediococcus acidilactici]
MAGDHKVGDFLDEKNQTRAEYQKKIHAQKAPEETSANEDSKNESRLQTSREQRFSIDEIAEEKSRALAKKLNIAIALLAVGIVLVFLVLFFIG